MATISNGAACIVPAARYISPNHMAFNVPFVSLQELHAIVLQMVVTLGLALLCAWLYADYRKPVFAAWATAWGLYVLRLGVIGGFLLTAGRWPSLLFWHQVITGWTALAILATALIFSRRLRWHRWYVLVLLFPILWSYVAIYRLNRFLLAAGPAVLFMSAATLWTGVVFLRYAWRTRSPGARVLAGAFLLWGLHHLDYPFLRAKGAWTPWGYYLDILFVLTVGVGILLLVTDDLRSGVTALATLSGEGLTAPSAQRDVLLETVLSRAVAIPAVRGAAVYRWDATGPRCELGAGVCHDWTGTRPADAESALLTRATTS
ncbi:MAG TPA: hypothetical protein VGT98_01875, partial [Candidatus Elarobacter sp.]|nr:hypothetical protein [Candidatus Elarobacter sp.]